MVDKSNNPKFIPVVKAINKHHKSVYLPKKIKFKSVKTGSCFSIYKFEDPKVKMKDYDYKFNIEKFKNQTKSIASDEYDLYFKGNEKQIIDNWFVSCVKTENITIDFFQNLLKDRMLVIHRIKVLERRKNELQKEKPKIIPNKKLNKNDQIKLNKIDQTISNIDQKININKIKYLDAVKNEKIWWLNQYIEKLENQVIIDNASEEEKKTLKYWQNLNIKNSNNIEILNEFKELKQKLSNINYFIERQNQIDLLENQINDLKNTKKYITKFENHELILKDISVKIEKLTKLKNKYVFEYIPNIDKRIIRSILYEKLKKIIDESKLFNDNNTTVKKHILDESVAQVCQSIKSNITNYESGHIKSFRIRKRKLNKESKNLKLENSFFTKGSIFKTIFKTVICERNRKKYNIFDIHKQKTTSNLVYNNVTGIYKLYVPKTIIVKKTTNANVISADLGKRTFATGLTKNGVVEIGRESDMQINGLVKQLNTYKDPKYKIRKKRIKMKKIRRRIKNMVNELHWKTINFMTNNYGTVIVGDIKSQEIVKQEGKINKFTKDVIHALSFYKFKQRLEYKCKSKGITYLSPSEYGSSKLCSECGHYNDVGSSKTYNCKKCGLCLDRDVNPTRTFLMLEMK